MYHTDENADSCPNISITTPWLLPTVITTQASSAPNSSVATPDIDSPQPSAVSDNAALVTAGSIIGGIIAILLSVTTILLVVVLIRQRKRKHFTVESNGSTYPNPVYEGKSFINVYNIMYVHVL